MDKVVLIFTVIILILKCITVPLATAECDSGWFGSKCQFKCHCANNTCNSTGHCLVNSKCQSGWFGLGCQYQDLTTVATATITTTPYVTPWSWLTDNSDVTCNTDQSLQSITVKWNTPYVFTWLQITIKEAVEIKDFNLRLNGDNTTLNCSNKEILNIYNQTFEIHCDVQKVTQLTIGGENVKNLCSLYINGGRNVALRQLASQSSEYTGQPGITPSASKAVDGDTNSDFNGNSCTHTQPGASPFQTWTVNFAHQHLITRFTLYNRQGDDGQRLNYFNLRTFNANNSTTFNYNDESADKHLTFQVLNNRSSDPVQGVTITDTITFGGDAGPILTLCEMESYGECPPGTWGLECENCSVNCHNTSCQRDSGLCDKGCHGFSDPPLCKLPCHPGTWGVNCGQLCDSPNCYNSSCNKDTGICDMGCDGHSDFPSCSVVCSGGKYGLNCSLNCSANCFNQSCDKTTGQCVEGCYGYSDPPMCSVECRESYWGKNCAQPCSPHCNNGTCNRLTSNCDMGCQPGYKSPNCTSAMSSPVDEPPLGAIIGPIIGAIVLILLVVTIIIFWRRYRGVKMADEKLAGVGSQVSLSSKKSKDDPSDISVNIAGNSIPSSDNNNYNKIQEFENTSIALSDLNSFMYSHTKEFFTTQFKKVPTAKNATTEVGLSEHNKLKNRYKNICAYDHSRVHLEINTAQNEGDYINASYIEGYHTNEKFIASQGPTKHIINDFIRMLWEQRVNKVVMLTNLIEEGKLKSEKYWPDDGDVPFGEIHVRLISAHTFADYTIRTIELLKKNEATQIITQFHFTSWPDQGVPIVPWGLVDFEQLVSAHPTTRPVVVHCSAGVGRTGTFIALHNVLREAEATGRVDFFKTLTKLREARILMIQTAEQYWFLHKAAQAAIVCIGTTVTTSDIVDRIKTLEGKSNTGDAKMEEEFKAVCAICESIRENTEGDDQSGEDNIYQNNTTDQKLKNRYSSMIPKPTCSPSLMCEAKGMDSYINAVFIPGFKKKDQQILTQLPMPTTVVDFWRLVTQYKISLIVAFEVDSMTADTSFGNYLPPSADQPLICAHLEIQSNSVNKTSLWEEQKLTVKYEKHKSFISKGHNESHSVVHLQCMTTDLDPHKLLTFIKQARSYNALAKGMILYTCRNGARYSGLGCVLSLLLDRMEHDSCLTVPLVVGSVKSIRPEVISTVDQYRVLYEVLQQSTDTTQYSTTQYGTTQYGTTQYGNVGNLALATKSSDLSLNQTEDKETNTYANL